MFGIIYGLIGLFGYTGSHIYDAFRDLKNKNNRTNIYYGYEMWIDEKGRFRDSKTNRHLIIGPIGLKDKHIYIKDAKNGTIIKDITKEKIEKDEEESKREAIKEGRDTYKLDGIYNDHKNEKCVGYRYKDVKNGEIYVERNMYGIAWYMRVKDGQFIRPVFNNKNVSTKMYDGIKKINERQIISIDYYNDRAYEGNLKV